MTKQEKKAAALEAYRAKQQAITQAHGYHRPARIVRERKASRAEQYARYLDCGPQNWDDRESPSGDY